MKRLWAPWRMEYILDDKKHGSCLFCDVSRVGKAKDRKNLILFREKECFVIMNKYPYNNGHVMVVPYVHTPTFDGLSDKVLFNFIKTIDKSVTALKKALNPDGFNMNGTAHALPHCTQVGRRY
jgi:ATP adenylyltransferase